MAIDIAGMIQNMQHSGFTTTSALSEFIDNAWSAGATQIHIRIEKPFLILSDDGCGMNKEELLDCNIFHRRKDASEKQGRFGIGSKHAGIHLSDTQTMTMYSFKEGLVHMIELNYQQFIRDKTMHLHVAEIGRSHEAIWNAYSFQKGTVIRIESTDAVLDPLLELLHVPTEKNLLYHFGLTYCTMLRTCALNIDGHTVTPVDIMQGDTYTQNLTVYAKDDLRIQYNDVYRDFKSSKKGKQVPFKQDDYEKVGTIRLRCAYRNDWEKVLPLPLKIHNKEEMDVFHGKFVIRNGKMVARFNVATKQSGDFNVRAVAANTHVCIEFDANEKMDALFGVQVNKSTLLEENIHEHVRATIEQLIKDYYDTIIAKIKVPKQKPVYTVEFSKSGDKVLIHYEKVQIASVTFKGQYGKHVDSFKETLASIGEAKFIEYIKEVEKLNHFIS